MFADLVLSRTTKIVLSSAIVVIAALFAWGLLSGVESETGRPGASSGATVPSAVQRTGDGGESEAPSARPVETLRQRSLR